MTETYVRVAVGFDYATTCPVRSVRTGGGARRNHRVTVLPLLVLISNSARRSAPRASRILAFRALPVPIVLRRGNAVCMEFSLIRRSQISQ